jgi:hypothetical protein
LGKGKARLEEDKLSLGIVQLWEKVKDVRDLPDPLVDDFTGEGDVSNGCSQDGEARWG